MNCVPNCAGCGKVEEETSPFQKCSRCKIVKYCSRDCQVSDYSQHKHDCRLFGEGHAYYEEDCPICLMQLPLETMEFAIKSCCSKKICDGCIWAAKKRGMGEICPMCKAATPKTDSQIIASARERVAKSDYEALDTLGESYFHGRYGLPRDIPKAIKLLTEAAKHGIVKSHNLLGHIYFGGMGGVTTDRKRAIRHYELAARKGHPKARHNLGQIEHRSGRYDRALRHYMIAANMGKDTSIKAIQDMFQNGQATKADYEAALKGYQRAVEELSSPERKEAKLHMRDTSGDCVIQ